MSEKVTFHPTPLTPFNPTKPKAQVRENQGSDFGKSLESAMQEHSDLKFSAHAMERLQQRNLTLQKSDLDKIGSAMEKARQKGVNASLVLLGDLALIASIRNRTIITAVDTKELKENIFTGIDGAVIIE